MPSVGSRRIAWLDMLRALCAVEIVGFHWLRALVKTRALGSGGDTFVTAYRQYHWGLSGFKGVLLSTAPSVHLKLLENAVGICFEFGWEAVHLFVLLSGFSLALTVATRRETFPNWKDWMTKRAERILIPFYAISIPLVLLMEVLAHAVHVGATAQLTQKLLQNGGGDTTGVIISQLLLVDPRKRLWIPVFLSPAWWFVPAILVGYLLFPLYYGLLKRLGAFRLLSIALAISVGSYCLIAKEHLLEWGWYFVGFNEAFNFCIGIVLGRMYSRPQGKADIESAFRAPGVLAIGIALAVLGNICNLYPASYPISSSIFTVGLLICGAYTSIKLASFRLAESFSHIDAYILYLLHQPFAFPLAVIFAKLRLPLLPELGFLIYLSLVVTMTQFIGPFIDKLYREMNESRVRLRVAT